MRKTEISDQSDLQRNPAVARTFPPVAASGARGESVWAGLLARAARSRAGNRKLEKETLQSALAGWLADMLSGQGCAPQVALTCGAQGE